MYKLIRSCSRLLIKIQSGFCISAVIFLITFFDDQGIAQSQGFDPSKIDWEKLSKIPMRDGFIKQFNNNCAACHGEDLSGSPMGTALVGKKLLHGSSVKAIAENIADGFPATGMPAWSEVMSENEIWNLALYVAEQRQGTTILDKRDNIPLEIPTEILKSERHNFRIEEIASGLDTMPFSIEPLPNGDILLSERMRGLRIISPNGEKSDYIVGAPNTYDDSNIFLGQVQGLGWMLDIKKHPDYVKNGWIYIHYTDRCKGCNDLSIKANAPVSMNRVVRGRIKEGKWIDEELIWSADLKTYSNTSDLAAGGRLSFDDKNNLYISVGMKDALDFMGIQDLDLPHGKIHRVRDDGTIPEDNPFVKDAKALKSIWTYGHRSTQGLEFNGITGELWSTEMGPRGGDELNLLASGANYGWPVFTSGVNYDGRPVNVAKKLGLELPAKEAKFPIIEWTPSVAISSFIIYEAEEFPEWNGNIIVGTLRATDLLRLEIEGKRVKHQENLLTDLARFRDIEIGPDGKLYVLLEHKTGGRIIRIKPAT
ncbi:MAG: PQQ-dependent sugar dehydrogenase [Pseudomonadota bacterium]|nr:PQQ-dependent sugar dehydrogenase [Pseudomonadota bacterium]